MKPNGLVRPKQNQAAMERINPDEHQPLLLTLFWTGCVIGVAYVGWIGTYSGSLSLEASGVYGSMGCMGT